MLAELDAAIDPELPDWLTEATVALFEKHGIPNPVDTRSVIGRHLAASGGPCVGAGYQPLLDGSCVASCGYILSPADWQIEHDKQHGSRHDCETCRMVTSWRWAMAMKAAAEKGTAAARRRRA